MEPTACVDMGARDKEMACVDIKALPLQLLLRDHEAWRGKPVVVVDRDTPNGTILWANRQAAACRIFPGMRYAAGLSLSRELYGGCVPDAAIDRAIADVTRRLWGFSPSIEPSETEPGVFWLDASGLANVFPSLRAWAVSMCGELWSGENLHAVAAVGFSRFGCYAAARAGDRTILFESPAHEQRHVRGIPISRLHFDPAFRDMLQKLGIETVGDFIDLPVSGIRSRFGAGAEALHRLARGSGWSPLQPRKLLEPIEETTAFDWPEEQCERILLRLARMIQDALEKLAERNELLKALEIVLTLDNGQAHAECIAPAAPTHNAYQVLLLVRLRIESVALTAGVVKMTLHAEGAPLVEGQLELFRESHASCEEAQRAFAALRARLGNDAVVFAEVQPGHLPEAQYLWKPLDTLAAPQPAPHASPGLVRRVYTPAIELPPRDRREPDGWLIAGVKEGPVEEVLGPYYVSGGWWVRETTRAYHYVRTRSGRWFWIYRDEARRRWYLHGEVQ